MIDMYEPNEKIDHGYESARRSPNKSIFVRKGDNEILAKKKMDGLGGGDANVSWCAEL